MNLLTKLAYNPITRAIQAILPGGVSLALPDSKYAGVVTTWTANNSLVTSGSTTIKIARNGNIVTATIPAVTVTMNGSDVALASNAAIPAEFRPPVGLFLAGGVVRASGVTLAPSGVVRVSTSGQITFYRDNTTTTSFGAGASGLFEEVAVSWVVI